MNDECIKSHNDMIESRNELFKTMQSLFEMLQEQAANRSTHTPEPSRRFNSICYNDNDDDDDEESTIPLNEIISQIPSSIAITPKKELDEFIESSVEDHVPILSESEDTSDKECDLPFCDNFVTFSNPLFYTNDDLTSSNEGVPEENVLEDIKSKDFYFSNLDEPALLVTPLFDANEDECFDPGGNIDEINADVSTDIEDGYHDSEGDIIYLESLLINDIIPNLPPEVFLDHDPRSIKDEPDNDDFKSMVKVFDPRIHEKIISPTYVMLPFEYRHYLSLIFVIKIFLPFLTYLVNSLLLLSSGNEDTIFDPDISTYSLYFLKSMAYESSMMIFPFFLFLPRGQRSSGIASDYEDSRAHGFVHHSLELLSLACLYIGI
ncbi:hypothetical protein Tco_0620111 [Tanacetum coccineum]